MGFPLKYKVAKCGLSGRYHYTEQVSVLPWNSKWKNADYLDSIITWNRYRFSPGIQNDKMPTIWTVSLHGTGIGSPLEFKMEKCGLSGQYHYMEQVSVFPWNSKWKNAESGQYHYMEQVSVLPWNSKWKNADYLDSIITGMNFFLKSHLFVAI